MRIIFLIISILVLVSCSKPKTVLICGDHVCINKDEAEKYFEENLSIEVKIIEKKNKKTYDLVELNMQNNIKGEKKVSISKKINTEKKLKVLSKKEIREIKKDIKSKKNYKKTSKMKKKTNKLEKVNLPNVKENEKKFKNIKTNTNNKKINVVDVCTILEKCSIDEISKYLLDQGKKKDFPDLTIRQ